MRRSPCRRGLLAAAVLCCLLSPLHAQVEELVLKPQGDLQQLLAVVDGEVLLLRQTPNLILEPALRDVPGRPAWGVTWTEVDPLDPRGRKVPWFAVSPRPGVVSEPRSTSYDLLLRYERHDPLVRRPSVPGRLDTSSGRLWIVQYWTQGLQAYRDVLASMGAESRLFLANHANVVAMDPSLVTAVEQLPFVRSVSCFHAAYRVEQALLDELAGLPAEPVRRVNVLTTRRGPAAQRPVAERVRSLGGRVDHVSPETFLMSVTVTTETIAELARLDDVQWIDRWGPPEDDMNIARALHGADFVETTGGYTGAGTNAEVLDSGCDQTHPDLQNFLVHGNNTPGSHGTATSGIICGSGAGNFNARGAMPDAMLIIADYNGLVGSRYNHTGELQNPALPYKAVLQSNSWGNTRTLNYTSISQDMDLILFDHSRITITQSQSNAGDQMSRPQAWAKNIIAVGGIRHYNTLSKNDDQWAGGASIGPAADGRIKPDLASFYDNILCTDRPGGSGYSSGNYTSSFGGTSGATPIVAGHIGLLYGMWADGVFGNPAGAATVFDDRPWNTTMKALVINTASQWTFAGTGSDLTRVHQGWGHPDLQNAWDLRNDMYIVDETDLLPNLQSTVHNLVVPAGTSALKATLVWRDNPGTTSSSQHRINNLDLKVTAPGGAVYWGNNGLLGGMWSTSGGSPNTVDTVENVFVQSPSSGTWQVEVIAAELNQDNHVETGALDADYALVVTGVDPGTPPALAAAFSGFPTSGATPLVVSFTDQSSGTVTSWSWNFGDGGTSTAQNPTHTYTAPGTYTVSLTVSGPGGSDTHTKAGYVTVTEPPPVADFVGSPTTGAVPLTTSFTDQSTGIVTSWSWIFGDGGTSSAQNPTHTYNAGGVYTVSLTVSGPGGSDTETKISYVNVGSTGPTADFTADVTSGPAPLTVNFTDQSTGLIFTRIWQFGDGLGSTDVNPTHVYQTPGTYTVTLLVIGAGGSDVETKTNYISVGDKPFYATFDGPTTLPGAGSVGPEDVVFFEPSTGDFSLYFDGSDVGLAGANVDAIDVNDNGSIFMSFDATVNVPGLAGGPSGTTVTPDDIVLFAPSSTGSSTAGSFVFVFDGSDVGLSGDDIDGLYEIQGFLLMSTAQTASLPGIGPLPPEDLVLFFPLSTGANTTGVWIYIFNGSDVGFAGAAENLDALHVTSTLELALSTSGGFSAGSVTGGGEDLSLFSGTFGLPTVGTLELLTDVSTLGTTANVDGVTVVGL